MMIADDNDEPLHPDLIPKDHAEAMRRFEAVRPLNPAALANLEKQELLLAWWSFCWLEAALHPDDVEVWPEEVADALPLAAEAFAATRQARSKTVNTTPPKPSAIASCMHGKIASRHLP